MRAAGLLAVIGIACASAVAAPPEPTTAEALTRLLTVREGRPVLLHLWASWCRPCIAEWPHLAEALRELEGRAVDVVVVSVDEPDAVEAAGKILDKVGKLPGKSLVIAPEAVLGVVQELDPSWDGAVPTTLLVGKDGRIILAQRGATNLQELADALERAAPATKATR